MTDVAIRELHTVAEVQAAEALMVGVWGSEPGSAPFDASTMMALAHAGNYVAGAYVGDQLVGCAAGFFWQPSAAALHSHVAAVDGAFGGRGIGEALKLHQRDWCLERGVTTMTWTFDPLIARNAYFNLVKLGARPTEYLVDFYGPMDDGLNLGSPSDRLMVSWDLTGATPPAPASESDRVIEVPDDIESLRRTDPAEAARWRERLRAELAPVFDGPVFGAPVFDGAGPDAGAPMVSFRRGAGYLVKDTP